jgi:hypothetical protein
VALEEIVYIHLADPAAALAAVAAEVLQSFLLHPHLAAVAAVAAAEYYRGPAAPAAPAVLQPAVRAVVQILLAQ